MNNEEIKKVFQKQVELNSKEGIDNPMLFYVIKDDRMDVKRVMFNELETLIPSLNGFEIEEGKEHMITPIFKRIGIK
jgi:hypothetical protein